MFNKILASIFATGTIWLSLSCHASEIITDVCNNPATWGFLPGTEFPGAKGSLAADIECGKISVEYDFSNGGRYVAVFLNQKLPEEIEAVNVAVRAEQDTEVTYRFRDQTGRFFQGRELILKKGQTQKINCSINGPWTTSWGGESSAKNPQLPLKEWGLVINRRAGYKDTGKVILLEQTVTVNKLPEAVFAGQNFEAVVCGWNLRGQWMPQIKGALLKIVAVSTTKKHRTALKICFPNMGRESIWRYQLEPAQQEQILYYNPPLLGGGNPRNIYQIELHLQSEDGTSATIPILLSGIKSGGINLGEAVNSQIIANSKFGTCVHFSYGTRDAFKGWKSYEKLLDAISRCGLKWIRDGIKLDKDQQGNYLVRQYDLEWIKAAQKRGIETILIIGMHSRDDLPDFLRQVEAVIRDTAGMVNIYELGNEPNNFGDWIKKYGGTWNGKEKDNSTSPWVKAHLQYTNAAADLIKKLRPNATVIGTGACPPTNFRYLELGLSNNVDGLVEHPYSFSLTPEKVPFGLGLSKRDGIELGDREHSFAGLINSYIEHFKKTGKMRSIWITEFGFTSFWFNGKTEKGLYAGFSEEAQAVYLIRRFILGLTLPVAVSCQYDFIDDYNSDAFRDEANFGIIRADYSPKPAYYAIQRMTSLFNGYNYDREVQVKVENSPLHRSCMRGDLVKDWDKASISADNGIMAFGFISPALPDERMLAVWSAQPYSREFNNRTCSIRIKNWADFTGIPVVVDLITGKSYDVPLKAENGELLLDNICLKENPIIIKFFKRSAESYIK